MDNFALFDDRNDALLLFNKINSPICILLNLFAIYLIVFKSSSEMGEYRWYLLHYQIWVSVLDIFLNVFFQPIFFYPIPALAGRGFLISKIGFSTSTCLQIYLLAMWGLMASVMALFFYRYQCVIIKQYKAIHNKLTFCIFLLAFIMASLQFNFIQLSQVDPSQWPELLRKQSAEAMELLKIQNFFYQPASLSYGMAFSIGILSICISALIIMGLSCHMQYIFRKQCVHLTVHTQELQKKFLKAQIIQVTIPFVFIFVPSIIFYIRALDGRLGLQIINDVVTMMLSIYGAVATVFLISFNTPYREFLSGKVREFGKSLSCLGTLNN